MLNKVFLSAVVACALMIPSLAHSWSLTTRINSSSGQIQVNAYPVQTGGSVLRSIASGTPVNVVITPASGYVISKVQQGATYLSVTPSGQTVSIPVANTTSQTINVWFAAKLVSVTATAGVGGSVAPTGTRNYQQGAAARYVFTPAAGNSVLSISGVPVGASVTPAVPAPMNTAVTVAFAVPAADVTMNGVFMNVIANAGTPQTALVGGTVVLDGSASVGATSYAWSQTTGPVSVTLSDPTAQKPTFAATVVGAYQFMLTVNGVNSAYTSVVVSASAVDSAQTQCQNCHQPLGIGVTDSVFAKWSVSPHPNQSPPVMCYSCHVGANTGGHPGPALSTMGNICLNCHAAIVPTHPFPIGTSTCISCHDPHSTTGSLAATAAHYNNSTSAGYPASYVTSRSNCTDCHYGSDVNAANRHAWAQSGHAMTTDTPWREYDFKTMNGCVQCHTTSGFIAYSTGKVTTAWGTAADSRTKEVLTCVGCHTDINTGAIRPVTPISPYTGDTYTNEDVGMSNICMDCHSGRANGASVANKAVLLNVTGQLVQPHYLAAGGILHAKGGYRMSGQTYALYSSFYSYNTHRRIGMGNQAGTGSNGPCVACHKNPVNGHTFRADFENGVVPVCANCHTTALDANRLAADKAAFATALNVLNAELTAKGYTYSPVYPYFTNKNWGGGQSGADTMGAAFNYVLLVNEPGAYAHNQAYTKQLILDALDYLDDGIINGSVEATVQGLVNSGGITQSQADAFVAYKNASVCTNCHGGPADTSVPMATNAHPAHLTGPYGPGSYLGSGTSACQACHPYPNGHADGTVEVMNGAGSACAGCHPGALPAWNGGVRLGCTSCHGTPQSTLPNSVAAAAKPNFATTGHGTFSVSNQCTSCHDANSAHISGSLGVTNRLLSGLTGGLNAECTYCHNDGTKVSARFQNMSTHVTVKGGGQTMDCAACHDPHGTTNLSMIRTTINGQTITYTDRSAGLVDTVTNQGLCQVCHTQTAHYRAGVPETNHPTINCLSCHSHKAGGAAFRPNGACNACHGYPPAPRSTLSPITFGTMGNWSSARFEDYSGGGGAHLVAQHVSPNARPSEGWANCAVCHNGGVTNSAPYHRMMLPLTSHIDNVHMEVDPKLRFADGFIIYTGAKLVNPPARNVTGSCFNVSCHMSTTPKWSIER